jgi:hypothetical protein
MWLNRAPANAIESMFGVSTAGKPCAARWF